MTERPATAGLMWRDTTRSGTALDVPYVYARPGADPVTVAPELDLGTTGRLAVRPWTKDEAAAGAGGAAGPRPTD
ncbi:hypothetical protein GT045_07895 [Streptomyces sp. SID486]|nr:hypothetical protein [Streptomyces sp. SID486]